MVLTAIVSLLAALGLVLLVWCLTGAWLLPSGGSGYSVRFPDGSEESWRSVRAGLFLLRSGLSRQTLFLVDCGLSAAQRRQLAPSPPSGWRRRRRSPSRRGTGIPPR